MQDSRSRARALANRTRPQTFTKRVRVHGARARRQRKVSDGHEQTPVESFLGGSQFWDEQKSSSAGANMSRQAVKCRSTGYGDIRYSVAARRETFQPRNMHLWQWNLQGLPGIESQLWTSEMGSREIDARRVECRDILLLLRPQEQLLSMGHLVAITLLDCPAHCRFGSFNRLQGLSLPVADELSSHRSTNSPFRW